MSATPATMKHSAVLNTIAMNPGTIRTSSGMRKTQPIITVTPSATINAPTISGARADIEGRAGGSRNAGFATIIESGYMGSGL
jgi:hypothetical protein